MPSDGLLGACCRGLAATPLRLLRPRPRDRRLMATIDDAGHPRAGSTVRVTALPQGTNKAPTAVVAEGVWRPPRTTLGMTSFLVEHPTTRFIVDAAICGDVHERVLGQMPSVLRLLMQPDRPVTSLGDALAAVDRTVDDIDFVLATHLHWDHVSGLLDLPPGTVVRAARAEIDFVADAPTALVDVTSGPLSAAELQPFDLDGPAVSTFTRSHDLLGDGSVLIVDLAGHTPGSVGVLLATPMGPVLLAGDAVWHNLQIANLREKAPFPGVLVDDDRDATFRTLHRLHAASHLITIVPSHDWEAAVRLASHR